MVVVPQMPERLAEEKMAKVMKKVIKEGGKRGIEIEGAADMGGLKFFCTKIQEPENQKADLDMVVESVKAMNVECDPAEEERKGCSGRIGKMVQCFHDECLSIVCYVPEERKDEITADGWLKEIVATLGVKCEIREDSNEHYAQIAITKDAEKGVFPLKLRDNCITFALNILRKKDLFPEDEDDEDEMCFGDDDFPEF